MAAEFDEAAAKHMLKMRLLTMAFLGAGFTIALYCVLLAGLYVFRGSMSNESLLAISGVFGPVFGMVLQQQLSIMKDGSGFAFGSSQSSADKEATTQTLASATNKMADEGKTRAKTDAAAAGVVTSAPGTVTETTTVTTPPVEKLVEAVAENTAVTKENTDALKPLTEELKP